MFSFINWFELSNTEKLFHIGFLVLMIIICIICYFFQKHNDK